VLYSQESEYKTTIDDAVDPDQVHGVLGRHLLVDGYRFVLDVERSRGCRLVDAITGESYLDMYTFFASSPLGINPPQLVGDPGFMRLLAAVAANKPANSDVYTTHMARFVEVFVRVLGDPDLPHLFFVEGGALAVENAVKCAFDWKSRHNERLGRSRDLGTKILHLTRAFHGRSGYTLSVTNTDPVKTDRYPLFDWPRIDVPALRFSADGVARREEVEEAEHRALDQARAAFAAYPHDIACFLFEPIQGEGGDNHMRAGFLRAMQDLCHAHDALFVVDEVQTGVGLTGKAWAYQHFGLEPDIVAFAKKVQVGGIMAGRRVDEVPDNVFAVSGRINSTWGGNLTDMVRSRRMLEVIEDEHLVDRAARTGAYFLDGIRRLAARYPRRVANPRGRGLMCAFDLPTQSERTELVRLLREEERVLMLPGGQTAVRVRPALTVTVEEIDQALAALDRCLRRLSEGVRV
jgi:L-lysine 6-transaminase